MDEKLKRAADKSVLFLEITKDEVTEFVVKNFSSDPAKMLKMLSDVAAMMLNIIHLYFHNIELEHEYTCEEFEAASLERRQHVGDILKEFLTKVVPDFEEKLDTKEALNKLKEQLGWKD